MKSKIRKGSGQKIRQNITRVGVWGQGSEKLETSLVPSEHAVTLCKISQPIILFELTIIANCQVPLNLRL